MFGLLLAATTGIIGASVVLLGMLSLPVMMRGGYSKSLAVGTSCATGTLGILIPPSIMLVLMADRLAVPEASVGDLFMGAFFPGLILGALYIIFIILLGIISPKSMPAPEKTDEVGWEATGEHSTAVALPFGGKHLTASLDFDVSTGLPVRFSADRYKGLGSRPVRWHVDYADWGPTTEGVLLPGLATADWESTKAKIEAALAFVRRGGKEAVITSLDAIEDAVRGCAGTRITAGEPTEQNR